MRLRLIMKTDHQFLPRTYCIILSASQLLTGKSQVDSLRHTLLLLPFADEGWEAQRCCVILLRPHRNRNKTQCGLHLPTPSAASQSILRIVRVANPDFFKDGEGSELRSENYKGRGQSERRCHSRKPKGSGEDRDWLNCQDKTVKGKAWSQTAGRQGWRALWSEPTESKHWFCHLGRKNIGKFIKLL